MRMMLFVRMGILPEGCEGPAGFTERGLSPFDQSLNYKLMLRNHPHVCYLTAKSRRREEFMCLVFARQNFRAHT
ncbi:MAG TPA: hypothetical protein PKV71_10385, partial [Calditrichia bacterium]|nr:hypothetical protein [Calditrichia bacterium]HQV32275.1 hypothetical protein [Calditrichia bacterium]